MSHTSYEVVPVNGQTPEQFNRLREVVDYLRENAYENFYIQIDTEYDKDEVVSNTKAQLWEVLSLDNVDDIY